MTEEKKYADQWNESAKYFYQNDSYSWMSSHIEEYHSVLEVGCGTGYSTLNLAQKGHIIQAIDKNQFCLERAKTLIKNNNLENCVHFISGDVADDSFRVQVAKKNDFELVVCWNVGTYWNNEMFKFYLPHMRKYGLTDDQIRQNPESSYAELMLWDACDIASKKKVPIQIIERIEQELNQNLKDYYGALASEFGYRRIKCDIAEGSSISKGGRVLTISGLPNMSENVKLNFLSIVFEY